LLDRHSGRPQLTGTAILRIPTSSRDDISAVERPTRSLEHVGLDKQEAQLSLTNRAMLFCKVV